MGRLLGKTLLIKEVVKFSVVYCYGNSCYMTILVIK